MDQLKNIFRAILKELFNISDFSPTITPAPKKELGEFCINIFPLAKPLSKSPNEIAEMIASRLKDEKIITNATATGGYVNFFLSDEWWFDFFKNILQKPDFEAKNETAIVDYIGMNVGKPPHIGHICTPLLGQAIINTLRFLGYNVIGDSHLGDWGALFGKLIIGFKKYGDEQKLKDDAISHLLEVYVAINADIESSDLVAEEARNAFKELSEWNPEYTQMWHHFTTATISTNKKILELMHIHQDCDVGESFYEWIDLPVIGDVPKLQFDMNSVVEELIEKGIATQNDDGSVGVIFDESTKMPSTILRKKDGTNLYLTSDLAAIKYRLTNGWNPSKILYFVDVRQSLHLRQAFWIAQKAWPELTQNVEFVHAANGAIVLPEGAMSTRKWNIIRLDALVEGGFDRVKSILEQKWRIGENLLSDADITEITIAAIKYSYLSQDRERDVVFSWDKALNFEWNSGPYIQYAFVRAKKIVSSADISDINSVANLSSFDKDLIAKLSEFENKILDTANRYKPHILANYAYELAVECNSFYVHTPKILEEMDQNLKNFRLKLLQKTAETLSQSFEMLGIKMPTEM